MPPNRTLVVILAGGAGGRLELLTKSRAKPAVPFGGRYRLIDFPLSNCRHSGLSDVWVVQQFNPVSLTDHLSNGRPWDLDRTYGGLLILHPRLGEGAQGWHKGTADALWRNAPLIEQFGPDQILVLSADAVYRLDYRRVVEQHQARESSVTVVSTRVAASDAGRYGVLQTDADGTVRSYEYKPDRPKSDLVSNEVYVFSPEPLLRRLGEEAQRVGDEGLSDLGDFVLPALVDEGGAHEYRFEGYWRDVGTLDSYWQAHMDLVAAESPINLDDPTWPILSATGDRGPARVLTEARLGDVLLSPGTRVSGTVERSVLGPGVAVEPGAVVRDSVLLDDAVVRQGAVVERAIVDSAAVVERGARVGDCGGAISLIGPGERVRQGSHVPAGARVPES